jgi:hypothetical protein
MEPHHRLGGGGVNIDGSQEILITVFCPAYEADLNGGRQRRRHLHTDDGMITHSLVLA